MEQLKSENYSVGVVKSVISGDTIVVRDKPRGGPPPERTIILSNVVVPKLGRRGVEGKFQETKEEAWAWEARELVRSKVLGREVAYISENKVQNNREYGTVFTGKTSDSDRLADLLVEEGLAEVRRAGIPPNNENFQRLSALEDRAKSANKGKWSNEPGVNDAHIRNIVWTIDNPQVFVELHRGQEIPAYIEHVRDGSTFRIFLIIDNVYYSTMFMLSGVKSPPCRTPGATGDTAASDVAAPPPAPDATTANTEVYADEAKFFVECRLLNRPVKVILETTSNQNLIGSVLHPNGNIAELLLNEGLARCVDWSMGSVTGGAEKLRAAEKKAKEKRLRLWKGYNPPEFSLSDSNKQNGEGCEINMSGKVIEVGNGDNLTVKLSGGQLKKFYLSSVRPPRLEQENNSTMNKTSGARPRPLYDIPYMFEAREFLRKKLVGKKVNIHLDYCNTMPTTKEQRYCATVTVGSDTNVAEALVSKGLASVVRYRANDDNRSSTYDALLAAEAVAQKKAVGIHSKKEPPTHRIADVSGSVSKQFFPFLKRAGRLEALVEFVASGSRLRLYVPKDTCLITFLCAGVECPRAEEGVPFGFEAHAFTREACLQREVEIEIDSMDKAGNFIGWLYYPSSGESHSVSSTPGGISSGTTHYNTNLSVALIEHGLASVHFSAERTPHYTALSRAEDRAKQARLGIWLNPQTTTAVVVESEVEKNDSKERKVSYRKAYVTAVVPGMKFYCQYIESEANLNRITEQLATEYTSHPPLAGAYIPKKGDTCAAQFVDDTWYRAKVEAVNGPDKVHVFYIDYGNTEVTSVSRLASLPHALLSLPGQAHLMKLACVQLPPEEEDKQAVTEALQRDLSDKVVALNTEYESEGIPCVTVMIPETEQDVTELLLDQGLVLVEKRREGRLKGLLDKYESLQRIAMRSRSNIWRYGDFTEDA